MDVEPVDVPHLLYPVHVFFFTVHRSSGRVARASSRASRTTALVSRSQRALTIAILWSSDSFVTFIRQLPDSGQRSYLVPHSQTLHFPVPIFLDRRLGGQRIVALPVPLEISPPLRYIPLLRPGGADRLLVGILCVDRQGTYRRHRRYDNPCPGQQNDALQFPPIT